MERWKDYLFYSYTIASGVLAFIVDAATFGQMFGINLVVVPNTNPVPLHIPPIILKLPVDAELGTFLIWLYAAIAIALTSRWVAEEFPDSFVTFLPVGFCTSILVLLVVWLRSFGYISASLYIFLLPTAAYIGLAWYAGLGEESQKGFCVFGGVILLGLTLIWFRTNYLWTFPRIIGISTISALIGSIIGYGISSGNWILIDRIRYVLL